MLSLYAVLETLPLPLVDLLKFYNRIETSKHLVCLTTTQVLILYKFFISEKFSYPEGGYSIFLTYASGSITSGIESFKNGNSILYASFELKEFV